MNADDAVRLLNLLGSVVLFVGAYRAQSWTRTQADIDEDAAEAPERASGHVLAQPAASGEAPPAAVVSTAPAASAAATGHAQLAAPGAFRRAGAEVIGRPYFDRPAYLLFCLGFAITTVASGIDLWSHNTFSRLLGTPPVAASKGDATSEPSYAH
jgi:hypothetical protein